MGTNFEVTRAEYVRNESAAKILRRSMIRFHRDDSASVRGPLRCAKQ